MKEYLWTMYEYEYKLMIHLALEDRNMKRKNSL